MRISIYANRDQIPSVSGDTSYLLAALDATSHDVDVHSEPDPEACRLADVVFIRFSKAGPCPTSFLQALRRQTGKLFVNPPESLLNFDSKRHLLLFPHLTAPTIIARSRTDILRFARKHGRVVLKPLRGHGGKGVLLVDWASQEEDAVWKTIEEHMERIGTPVVQAYIPEVREWGDKRVNVVGYEVISAVRTLPAKNSFICHRSAGGREVAADLTDRDQAIIREVLPFLIRNRIWWAGIDIVGPYLGEVNIWSPMMIRRADEAHGTASGKRSVVRVLDRYARSHGL